VGVRSPIDGPRDRAGVPGLSRDLRHELPPDSLLIIGEGKGVMSAMAARYGEARADAVLGEAEEAKLEVERLDRSELPMIGSVVGDVIGSTPGSVITGVSKKMGVSFRTGLVIVGCLGVGTLVWMYNPADAGVEAFGLRCASGGCVIEVSRVWREVDVLCAKALSFEVCPLSSRLKSGVEEGSFFESCLSGVRSSLLLRLMLSSSRSPTVSRPLTAKPLMS
jgi:hypothetical protein